MASSATLTIKVGANVKDAAQQLQALGYNIETVKKKTDKANDSASTWEKTLAKSSENAINKVVELGGKYLSVATAITTAWKVMKSFYEEGLKYNTQVSNQLDELEKKANTIQGRIGGRFLKVFEPILDVIGGAVEAIENLLMIPSAGSMIKDYRSTTKVREKEVESIESTTDAVDELTESAKLASSALKSTASTFKPYSEYDSLASFIEANGASSSTYTKDAQAKLLSQIEGYMKTVSSIMTSSDWQTMPKDMRNTYTAYMTYLQEMRTSAIISSYSAGASLSDILGGYSEKYNSDSERSSLLSRLANIRGARQTAISNGAGDRELEYYTDAINGIQEQLDALVESATEVSTSWSDAFSDIYSSALSCFSGIFSLTDAYYDNQIEQIENSEMAEEEKNAKLNEIEKKKFQAEQANSYANATISFAEGLVDIWSKYASAPHIGAALTALLTANTGVQFATISQQAYTPSLASGGIVTSPTHAFIGEGAEHEAVIPLSKLEDFVNRDREGGIINLSITCSGGSKEEDVFRAIERAQRTGLLPHWRYA